MTRIITKFNSSLGLYFAYFEDKPTQVWHGRSPTEAVGRLVTENKDKFKVVIFYL